MEGKKGTKDKDVFLRYFTHNKRREYLQNYRQPTECYFTICNELCQLDFVFNKTKQKCPLLTLIRTDGAVHLNLFSSILYNQLFRLLCVSIPERKINSNLYFQNRKNENFKPKHV